RPDGTAVTRRLTRDVDGRRSGHTAAGTARQRFRDRVGHPVPGRRRQQTPVAPLAGAGTPGGCRTGTRAPMAGTDIAGTRTAGIAGAAAAGRAVAGSGARSRIR